MNLSENLKEVYASQYNTESEEWRSLGAKYKAQNIIELSKGFSFKNVLEVGAGEGSILSCLSKANFCENLNCVEISESGIEAIKSKDIKNLNDIILFDGYKIPYPDNHFDLVYCSHVMEHVEYERILLREIKRISKYQIFEVPIDFSFFVDRKIKHFLGYGHINIYTPSLFRFLLKTENFKVLKDLKFLFSDEILQTIYKNDQKGYYLAKVKFMIMKMFPAILDIKPSSYAVLTEKEDEQISIF